MIYNYCNHSEGKCPCLTCAERDCLSDDILDYLLDKGIDPQAE